MSKKRHKPVGWEKAKQLCRLNDDDVRMAQALGMAPGSLTGNIPNRREMWKLPVKEWVRSMYAERFGVIQRDRDPTYGGDSASSPFDFDDYPYEAPEPRDRKRRPPEEMRSAAAYVARELSLLPEVILVELFGSAVEPRPDECGDADLAVWMTDLTRLKSMQNAVREGLNRLLVQRQIQVDPEEMDIHILEPGSNRYRGRLCYLSDCPKRSENACLTDGCGAQPFLRQLPDYRHQPEEFELAERELLFQSKNAEAIGAPWYPEITDEDVPF